MISKIKMEKGNNTEDEHKNDEGQRLFLENQFGRVSSKKKQKTGLNIKKYDMLGKRHTMKKDKVSDPG
jgi:hypothetical protein